MPWSQLLRTRWVSGSVIFSTRPLSSSVASPCVTSSTFLPSLPARSRSMRGKRLNTIDIGIMRIDITDSCRSRVLRSRSARPAASCWCSAGSSALAVLRQHGLGDDQFAHQVDQLVDLLDRHAQRRRLESAARRPSRPWRAAAPAWRRPAGRGRRRGRRGRGRRRRRAGRARRVVEEAVARCPSAGVFAAARRARRRGSRSRRPAAAAPPLAGTWKVNRSSRSVSLQAVVTLKRRMPSAGLAAVERLDACPGR